MESLNSLVTLGLPQKIVDECMRAPLNTWVLKEFPRFPALPR